MEIIRDLAAFPDRDSAVAIGKFDGVHRGHQLLLDRLVRGAHEDGLLAAVFTFDPPPAVLFGDPEAEPLLTGEEQKKCFERTGIDVLVVYPFTRETAAMPPESFVSDILRTGMHARRIFCGSDISYGDGGKGDLRLLEELSAKYSYRVDVVEKLTADGEVISSTRIRRAIRQGHIDEANAMLGRESSLAR